MAEEHTRQLALSWQRNAAGWTRAVREQRIDSRRLVTDAEVVEAVLGCGLGGCWISVVARVGCAARCAATVSRRSVWMHLLR